LQSKLFHDAIFFMGVYPFSKTTEPL